MRLTEFEKVKPPTRRPWLLLVVLLAVGAVLLARYGHRGERSAPPPVAQSAADKMTGDGAPIFVSPASASAAPEAAISLMDRARTFETQGALVQARRAYLGVLGMPLSLRARAEAEKSLGRIHAALVLSPAEMPEKKNYVVERGDSLDRIARKFGASRRLIQKSNQITDANRIRPGDLLRVCTGQFLILVSKSQNQMIVYMNDLFFKRYTVSTGKFGKTPLGTFSVCDQIVEPVWWRPDGKEIPYGHSENILGTRWMALKATGDTPDVRGYGIHGTWDNASLGQPVSQGCIRMRNSDVEELFDIVPMGTQVVIAE